MKSLYFQYSFGLVVSLLMVGCDGSVLGPGKRGHDRGGERPVIVAAPPEDGKSPPPSQAEATKTESSRPANSSPKGRPPQAKAKSESEKSSKGSDNDANSSVDSNSKSGSSYTGPVGRPPQTQSQANQNQNQNQGQTQNQNQNFTAFRDGMPWENNNKKSEDEASQGITLTWNRGQSSREWINYIFSDVEEKLRSQLVHQKLRVRLDVRSVGLDDSKSENWVVAVLSFEVGESHVRDFVVDDVVIGRNVHSSDHFQARFRDALGGKKILSVKLERKTVSRFEQQQNANNPWSGTLSSVQAGKNTPVGLLKGFLGTLSEDQTRQIMRELRPELQRQQSRR